MPADPRQSAADWLERDPHAVDDHRDIGQLMHVLVGPGQYPEGTVVGCKAVLLAKVILDPVDVVMNQSLENQKVQNVLGGDTDKSQHDQRARQMYRGVQQTARMPPLAAIVQNVCVLKHEIREQVLELQEHQQS